MRTGKRTITRLASLVPVTLSAALLSTSALAAGPIDGGATALTPTAAGTSPLSGGASILSGGLAPIHRVQQMLPRPPGRRSRGVWLTDTTITEYWPAPESWFVGRLVSVPGLSGRHRVDWLYSATGISMEGDGVGLDGRRYHINSVGDGGWVTAAGRPTDPARGWWAGAPYWRAGDFWRDRQGAVTFPLATGGWSDGGGRTYVPLPNVTFAAGASLPLHYYRSIAVDPSVIPLGGRVYVPAYREDGHGGWFIAQDTGAAINGEHIDVYRPPPAGPSVGGRYLTAGASS